MNIFDYLFYRFYQYNRKRKKIGNNEANLEAKTQLLVIYAGLTGPIIVFPKEHFFPSDNLLLSIIIFISLYMAFVYFRFRNRSDLLIGKYRNCRLNKYIPDYILWLIPLLFIAIGVCVGVLALKILGVKVG